MPYVEGFGTWPFGEEWLLEAIASCYLPLIGLLERWAEPGERAAWRPSASRRCWPTSSRCRRSGRRFLASCATCARECHRLDIEGLEQRRAARPRQRRCGDSARRLRTRGGATSSACGGDLLGASAPAAGRRRDRAVDIVGDARGAAAARDRGRRAAPACAPASTRTARASATWSGGFWLPECAYRPGLEEPLPAAGVRAFCVDQTHHGDDLDQLEPVATPVGRDRGADRLAARSSLVWDEHGYPADPRLPRLPRARRSTACVRGRTAARPYDRDAARSRGRASMRATSSSRWSRGSTAYRAGRAAARALSSARSTPSCSATGGTRVRVWLEAVVVQADARGLALDDAARRARAPSSRQRPAADRVVAGAPARTCRTWDSPRVADLLWAARQRRARPGGDARAGRIRATSRAAGRVARRAARELLALQSSDWAFMETARAGRRLPGPSGSRGHAAELCRGARRPAPRHGRLPRHGRPERHRAQLDERLRGLAPGLSLAPLAGACFAVGTRPARARVVAR